MEIKSRKMWIVLILLCLTASIFANAISHLPDDYLGAEIYFVDTIQIQDAIVLREKDSGYMLINTRENITDMKKLTSKNFNKLVDEGWTLFDWTPKIFYCISDERLKKIRSSFPYSLDWNFIDTPIKLEKYEIYQIPKTPACYVLLMIKGDFFNYISTGNCLDCLYDKKLKFKNKNAFYPIVLPLL